jgi:hypothetical protein
MMTYRTGMEIRICSPEDLIKDLILALVLVLCCSQFQASW